MRYYEQSLGITSEALCVIYNVGRKTALTLSSSPVTWRGGIAVISRERRLTQVVLSFQIALHPVQPYGPILLELGIIPLISRLLTLHRTTRVYVPVINILSILLSTEGVHRCGKLGVRGTSIVSVFMLSDIIT